MKTDLPPSPFAPFVPFVAKSSPLSIPELQAAYLRSRSIADLLAWSDAVGAETAKLLAELRNLWRSN